TKKKILSTPQITKTMKNEGSNYQQQLDKIFSPGDLWKHRTLRTLFDPFSTEYKHTTMDEKTSILKTILDNGLSLKAIIPAYKDFYKQENKPDVVDALEDGLVRILEAVLER